MKTIILSFSKTWLKNNLYVKTILGIVGVTTFIEAHNVSSF